MESLDHHGQSTTTIFPSCTSVSLALFHHSGTSPHCPPGDFQQPLSADLFAPTFCGLIPCTILCHISFLNSPWKESDVRHFLQYCMRESTPIPAVPNFVSIPSILASWISQGPLVASHMPRGKWAGCSLYTKETQVRQHFLVLHFSLISYQQRMCF